MTAAHLLIKQQFPYFQGCQLTLLSQTKQFEITGDAVQILYDGHHHWITIVYIKGVLRHYYDSASRGRLTAMLKASITALFGSISKAEVLTINCPSVQQQKKGQ
ncbi:hypothetical protein EMCRGX_G002174 [Ephydatia muelleri]